MSLLHHKEKQNKNNDPLIRLMTPMIAGILVCAFCLVSMTWAWFTASVDTPTQTIQSATRSTSVIVYEVVSSTEKISVSPVESKAISLAEDTQTTDKAASGVTADDYTWELEANTSYEVVLTGEGDASKGYCKVEVSYTDTNGDPATETYITDIFEKDDTLKFTYNTGIFESDDDLTATQWKERVGKTKSRTLTIASYWGEPANETPQVALMSLRRTAEEEIMLLADGDVIGLAPIPCPEAKAETEVELEGFEVQESAEISAEEDYKVSLTLKEGYEMPSEVVVNIDGKDYVVSTGGAEASDDAPYYDAQTGVLTVPSALLSDGIKVSVKATATPIPEEEPEEEQTEEEVTEETTEEETTEEKSDETTEDTSKEPTDKTETTDDNDTEEDNSADTSSSNNVVADNPNKKEENGEEDNDEPVKTPTGDGGNDDDDEADNNSGSSSSGNSSSSGSSSSSGNNKEETEEKADVTLNLSQLTINLEETQIPTNADLVLTLSAKEDMELPEQIVITLDKTIRDENIEDEEIEEDKTEYIINTDGKDNPEGFEFDAESGELTISSELLEGVREITIADTEENEATEDDEKATLTFEVKNLTFDFTDDEIVTDEDVVITFTAGEGYELPETIIITIDGVEYIIYTSEEDSDKNPDGITFDIETGTLTISKDLLKDAEAITIAAEGVEKEDEESKEEENPDADKKDESEDKNNTDKENEAEGGETTDKEPEGGTDTPNTEDKTETEGGTDDSGEGDATKPEDGTDAPGGENTETTTPETNPDNTTDGEDDDNNGEDNGETEPSEPNTEVTTPTTPDTEDNTNTEQDGENVETEENGEGSTENGTEETGSADSSSAESSSNSGNDSSESDTSSESTSSTTPSVTPSAPTTSSSAASETSTSSASTQASGNSSSTSASSTPTSSTNSNSNGASQASGTTTTSGSKETSSEE